VLHNIDGGEREGHVVDAERGRIGEEDDAAVEVDKLAIFAPPARERASERASEPAPSRQGLGCAGPA
jgi:hypothetical protein